MSPEQRVLAGLEQSELAIRVVEDGIRDQNPLADDVTIKRLLSEQIELMRRLQNRTLTKTCLLLPSSPRDPQTSEHRSESGAG